MAPDEVTAYQVDPAHDGSQDADTLAPPLARTLSVDFPGHLSYPMIVFDAFMRARSLPQFLGEMPQMAWMWERTRSRSTVSMKRPTSFSLLARRGNPRGLCKRIETSKLSQMAGPPLSGPR